MIARARTLLVINDTRQYCANLKIPLSISVTPVTVPFRANLSTSISSLHKYLIPSEDLRITYSSSSGPGGQNVNKLATKVDVR